MKNYHIIVLGLVVVFGALLLIVSFKDSEILNPETSDDDKSDDFGEATADIIESAIDHLSAEVKWVTPNLDGVPEKPLPLTRSIPIWVKNNEEIDLLDPSSPQIRPPLDNGWAFKYGASVGRDDLLTLDEDNDGFTTLEEFQGGQTNPSDADSHPPYASKMT